MTVDRSLWADKFKNALPHWPCPTCGKGHFVPLDGKFFVEETGPSKAAHEYDDWEPDWIKKRVSGMLECTMPDCKELASVSGKVHVDFYQIDHDEYVDDNIFEIEFVSPAPIPISIPVGTPKSILDAIRQASKLIWISAESAANQIRQAVECLMDETGFPGRDSAGKLIYLHDRIEEFEKTDAENGAVLLATKWLGNTGSHTGGISRSDVLDAFDMVEFVLENRFGTAKAALMAKVAAVNAAKGPA